MLHALWPKELAALAEAVMVSAGLVPVALLDESTRWRLFATIPVSCSVVEVIRDPEVADNVAVRTSCNARSYSLVVRAGDALAEVRAAHTTDGQALLRSGGVEIISAQPGASLISLQLAAPVDLTKLSVTLHPLQ